MIMLDKKYKKFLEILDEEIEFYNGLFVDYLEIAQTIRNDNHLREMHLQKAKNYIHKYEALITLKSRLYNEIGWVKTWLYIFRF